MLLVYYTKIKGNFSVTSKVSIIMVWCSYGIGLAKPERSTRNPDISPIS